MCAEGNERVRIREQVYMMNSDGQPPPDLRYFKQPRK
jgi:hypothetical protein